MLQKDIQVLAYRCSRERNVNMPRNTLYLVIGLLVAGLIVVVYLYSQENQRGVEIKIDDQGISIEGN